MTYYQQAPAPAPAKPGRSGVKPWIVVVLVLVIGAGSCGIGFAIGAAGDAAKQLAGNTAPDSKGTAGGGGAAPTTKKDPNAISDEGTLVVGTDVQAGTYRTTVPAGSRGCYWARLSGTSGTLDDIIANDNKKAGDKVTVTIARSDKAFQTTGCGTWTKTA